MRGRRVGGGRRRHDGVECHESTEERVGNGDYDDLTKVISVRVGIGIGIGLYISAAWLDQPVRSWDL